MHTVIGNDRGSSNRGLASERFVLTSTHLLSITDTPSHELEAATDNVTGWDAVGSYDSSDLRACIEDAFANWSVIVLEVFTRQRRQHVGNLRLRPVKTPVRSAEIEIYIGASAWREAGAAREVIRTLGAWLALELGVGAIFITADRREERAMGEYRSIGFVDSPCSSNITAANGRELMVWNCGGEAKARDGQAVRLSTRYQDYVIRDGRFIGQFEEMYKRSAEVPWHQDETAYAILSDHTVAVLKRRNIASLLDVGCGLGYMAERLRLEIPGVRRVVGIDVSETAIRRGREMFPHIDFVVGSLADLSGHGRFDAVISKDVLWYVLDQLPTYLAGLKVHAKQWIYIGNSFPAHRPFYGDDIFPNASTLLQYLGNEGYDVVYSLVERDADYGGREYVHALIRLGNGG